MTCAGHRIIGRIIGLVVAAVVLRCSVRVFRLFQELSTLRSELAAADAHRKRLGVSGDLLGQTLSAVSLKGDLAVQLLSHDPAAARAEVAGLAEMARAALREARVRTADELSASLDSDEPGMPGMLSTRAAVLSGRATVTRFGGRALPLVELPPEVE